MSFGVLNFDCGCRHCFGICSTFYSGSVQALCRCTGKWAMFDNTHGNDSGEFHYRLLYSHYHGLYFFLNRRYQNQLMIGQIELLMVPKWPIKKWILSGIFGLSKFIYILEEASMVFLNNQVKRTCTNDIKYCPLTYLAEMHILSDSFNKKSGNYLGRENMARWIFHLVSSII